MSGQNQQIYEFDTFRLEVPSRKLLREGQPVVLQAKAFDMLVVLIENSGRLIGKDELFNRVARSDRGRVEPDCAGLSNSPGSR